MPTMGRLVTQLSRLLIPLLPWGCAQRPTPAVAPEARPDSIWVEETLVGLSLRERAAQLVVIAAGGTFSSRAAPSRQPLFNLVRGLGVGGIILFRGDPYASVRLTNELQQTAQVPLLITSDFERGTGQQVNGGTSFPHLMALGATGSENLAEAMGLVTAREAGALGIHVILAPVLDVNVNPANPIINVRSLGDDPALVGRLGSAFIRGAQTGGLLTTAKHFPGHGDTDMDSHTGLPRITAHRDRLESVELAPFRKAIEAGVGVIMVGHIAVPALGTREDEPATLSPAVLTQLLRQELGFTGLIVTDALGMGAVRAGYWTGEAAVQAVRAGADLLLMPSDPELAVAALVRAVEEGSLPASRLEEAVRRVLSTKAALGLHRNRLVDPERLPEILASPEHQEVARRVAEASLTLVRNAGGLIPLDGTVPRRVLVTAVSGDADGPEVGRAFHSALARRVEDLTWTYLDRRTRKEEADSTLAAAGTYDLVLAPLFLRVYAGKGTVGLPTVLSRFLEGLVRGPSPVVVIAFGSPYILSAMPLARTLLVGYSPNEGAQEAAGRALFGEIPITGHLPVAIPGFYATGWGMERPATPLTLWEAPPEAVGFMPDGFKPVDQGMEEAIRAGAFPGGVVLVGKNGAIVHHKAYGRMSYEREAPPMARDAVFDLASLTKVVGTVTAAMILVEEGRLTLDWPVRKYLPECRLPDEVTVRRLLTHSSGLPDWLPLYQEARGQEAFLRRICSLELVYPPGTESLYDDLGIILLGSILERVSGEPLDQFFRERIFEPLRMEETWFTPPDSVMDRVVPTEEDPWRGRLLLGEVHDRNAAALGGVAPHAGLFSTARDLAVFTQTMLNGGVYAHRRIVRPSTVRMFTRKAGIPGSTWALGWDTRSAEGSSSGCCFSPDSYGHLGFTGTSIWIDPQRKLFVVLLTNRVHPTRENTLIREVRPRLHDAVIGALAAETPAPGPGSTRPTTRP